MLSWITWELEGEESVKISGVCSESVRMKLAWNVDRVTEKVKFNPFPEYDPSIDVPISLFESNSRFQKHKNSKLDSFYAFL